MPEMAVQKGEFAHQKTFGWPNERENGKPKYSWITKTNSDVTPIFVSFFILCDDSRSIQFHVLSQLLPLMCLAQFKSCCPLLLGEARHTEQRDTIH